MSVRFVVSHYFPNWEEYVHIQDKQDLEKLSMKGYYKDLKLMEIACQLNLSERVPLMEQACDLKLYNIENLLDEGYLFKVDLSTLKRQIDAELKKLEFDERMKAFFASRKIECHYNVGVCSVFRISMESATIDDLLRDMKMTIPEATKVKVAYTSIYRSKSYNFYTETSMIHFNNDKSCIYSIELNRTKEY